MSEVYTADMIVHKQLLDVGRRAPQARWGSLALALCLPVLQMGRARGADQVDYRYEFYQEDANRIQIVTHSFLFEKSVTPWLAVKGSAVYDAVSGATPTGLPPTDRIAFTPPGPIGDVSSTVPTAHMEDIRRAFDLEARLTLGKHKLTPQFAYSRERDYTSRGFALNYAFEFNEKNTTLSAGWAHTDDDILVRSQGLYQHKYNDDFIVGLTQLLGPKTLLTLNFTYGAGHGYMSDPYKVVLFADYPQFMADPDFIAQWPEKRPRERTKEIINLNLVQAINPLRASIEGNYRFYHDSYGIAANTATLSWHQKISKYVVVSPSFRYYNQSAAKFYATQFPGDPSLAVGDPLPDGRPNPEPPDAYSSDHRLAHMQTFTYGIKAMFKVHENFTIDAGYQRYLMEGLDGGATHPSAFPKAHIFTLGARIWF